MVKEAQSISDGEPPIDGTNGHGYNDFMQNSVLKHIGRLFNPQVPVVQFIAYTTLYDDFMKIKLKFS